jgi:peptide deformylase
MILKFVDIKDPTLRLKAKPVGQIDKKIIDLILDMKETLRAADDPEGIGLAAPQIGKSIQLFIISYDGTERVVINPKIISINQIKKLKKTKDRTLEGCLSLPHYYGPIKRSERITISYTNEKGERIDETFEGFLAHIVEHEMDHLNGVLFIDHILTQNAPLYLFDGDEFEEVELA